MTPAVAMPLLVVVATLDVTLPRLAAMPKQTADVKSPVVATVAARAAAVVACLISSTAIVVAARRKIADVVAIRMVAMLPRLAVVMPPSPAVAIVAARAAAARAVARADAARADAAKIVAARAAAARAVATSATPVVATMVDVMPPPLAVALSPPVDVVLLVRPMPSRCPPRRSPMLPR
ncbi:MAG: hypothetical protein VX431_00875 [Planctomycetota bacterium]|nr:hypothetical protein [Planctomycetota bacterium]